jgi:hypothetical protein
MQRLTLYNALLRMPYPMGSAGLSLSVASDTMNVAGASNEVVPRITSRFSSARTS